MPTFSTPEPLTGEDVANRFKQSMFGTEGENGEEDDGEATLPTFDAANCRFGVVTKDNGDQECLTTYREQFTINLADFNDALAQQYIQEQMNAPDERSEAYYSASLEGSESDEGRNLDGHEEEHPYMDPANWVALPLIDDSNPDQLSVTNLLQLSDDEVAQHIISDDFPGNTPGVEAVEVEVPPTFELAKKEIEANPAVKAKDIDFASLGEVTQTNEQRLSAKQPTTTTEAASTEAESTTEAEKSSAYTKAFSFISLALLGFALF
jgi:hypothetical protein